VLIIGGMMMIRSISALALLLLILTPSLFAQPSARDPHLRFLEPELRDDLERGSRVSPTLQQLVARLEDSDVVVYLMFDRVLAPAGMAGHVSLVSTVGSRRYLRLSINRRTSGCQRLAILGHELQHAVEIAEAADAVDQAGVASLYRQIGFSSANGGQDTFDSKLAIDIGQQVRREALSAPPPSGAGSCSSGRHRRYCAESRSRAGERIPNRTSGSFREWFSYRIGDGRYTEFTHGRVATDQT
jgi:hypothetical protein